MLKKGQEVHEAAGHGAAGAVLPLLAAAPAAVTVLDRKGQQLHEAVRHGNARAAARLLADAPAATTVPDGCGKLPLHHAHTAEMARLLLAAAPQTATAADKEGMLPLHWAAELGWPKLASVMLAAAPEAATVADRNGRLPLHWAWSVDVARLLLEAAPQTATVRDGSGKLSLHWAAERGYHTIVAMGHLLQESPGAAEVADGEGRTALQLAAMRGYVPAVQALLAAAPAMARKAMQNGSLTIHAAVAAGHAAAVQCLVASAPDTASALCSGRTPLQLELSKRCFNVACCLLPYGAEADVRAALAAAGLDGQDWLAKLHATRLPDAIATSIPLTAAEWARVPAPSLCLGRALPAALAHSHSQARQLVARLPAADVQRLHTAALCLSRVQRTCGFTLPPLIVERVLGLLLVLP